MKIGFVDVDLMTSPYLKRLNVELMKLANYYEQQGHTVEVLHPQSYIYDYDKLCIFCDERTPDSMYKKHPNIDYYGEYYNNKQYVPFSNDEINYGKTNYRTYDNLLKYFLITNVYTEKDIIKIKNTKWIRMYPNQKPIDIYEILTGDMVCLSDNNLVQRDNMQEIARKLSIYHYNIVFTHSQRITNQEDLDNFMFLKKINFGGLNAILLFEDVDKFKGFVADNYETLHQIQAHLYLNIAFNKNNLYTEDFYVMDLLNTFKKLAILTKYGVICNGANLTLYSNKQLTITVYYALEKWMKNGYFAQHSFIWFVSQRNHIAPGILKALRSFLSKRPEYHHWFYEIITGEEDV